MVDMALTRSTRPGLVLGPICVAGFACFGGVIGQVFRATYVARESLNEWLKEPGKAESFMNLELGREQTFTLSHSNSGNAPVKAAGQASFVVEIRIPVGRAIQTLADQVTDPTQLFDKSQASDESYQSGILVKVLHNKSFFCLF